MSQDQTKAILGFPREIKLDILKDALKEDNIGMFLKLSRILLDAPISQGGIETEAIEAIHNEHLDSLKNKVATMEGKERIRCTCACHRDENMMHMVACCDNGWITVPKDNLIPKP